MNPEFQFCDDFSTAPDMPETQTERTNRARANRYSRIMRGIERRFGWKPYTEMPLPAAKIERAAWQRFMA